MMPQAARGVDFGRDLDPWYVVIYLCLHGWSHVRVANGWEARGGRRRRACWATGYAAARAGYTTWRVRQLAYVHRLEEVPAVGTRVSAVGASGRRVRSSSWSFPHYIYIHIYYILYDGGRCMRDVRARSGIYFDEHRAGSKEATTLCRLF